MIGVLLLALSAALVTGACGSNASPADARPGDPTLAAIRADIFNGTCALSICHAQPTLEAKLDLRNNGLCNLLVSHKSCLFPTKLLVVPGKPEASFLLDKLRGTGLDGTPDPACGTTNERMPLGQVPLSEDKLAQIEAWIRAGADCGGDVPSDAGVDGPDDSLADVASVSAVATTLHVGERTQVTVTLTHGASAGGGVPPGQNIIIDVNELDPPGVLAFPNVLHVDPGVSSAVFDVQGQALGSATINVSTGANSMTITITVISLTLSDDKHSTIQLAGPYPGHGGL